MKSVKLLLMIPVAALMLFSHCSKNNQEEEGELVFHSLIAEKDTIAPGETVKIKATASGIMLNYYWTATLGDILGSGPEVLYAASPCSAGKNTVTCRITSGLLEEIKTVEITVYE